MGMGTWGGVQVVCEATRAAALSEVAERFELGSISLMHEYEEQHLNEEASSRAALVLQRRWREFAARREANKLDNRGASAAAVAAAAAAVAVADNGTEEPLTPAEEHSLLCSEYVKLIENRARLVEASKSYQHALSRHLAEQRQRKGEEPPAPATPEAEEQYWVAMRELREDQSTAQARRAEAEEIFAQLKGRHQGTIDKALAQEDEFRQYIKGIAEGARFVRTNQKLPEEDTQAFLRNEEEQRRKIQNARIRYILLRHEVEYLQKATAQRDMQQDGMNLIDFEQLKIENTSLNEKIEERNEDLVKLRRKVTTTIHVLTHVKEKLEFMKVENAQLRRQVAATEEELNGVRDKLAQTKRRRDHFTKLNIKMREKMPMVGSEKLLLDYEKRKTSSGVMRQNVVQLAAKHRELLATAERQQVILNGLQKTLALGTSTSLPPKGLLKAPPKTTVEPSNSKV